MAILEAAIRQQRLDSMREEDGALPEDGQFVPFSNVIKRFSWTPDAAVEARRGIGSWNPLGHDTGLETHSATIGYLLQGPIAERATLLSGGSEPADWIQWTAVKNGRYGNDITVTLLDGTASAGNIQVIGNDIVAEVGGTEVSGFVDLLNANEDVADLVTCATTAASDDSGTLQAMVETSLSGGSSSPFGEALLRDDNGILDARTIVHREFHKAPAGAAGYGKRTYVVLEGAKPASAKLPGDPGSAGPMIAEITYTAEKGRQYEISQPSAASVLVATSTESGDNGGTVTVEDDNGNQEAITIGGTGSVEFPSIDAVYLAEDIDGDLRILQGDSDGATLATIYGADAYDGAEGDQGVPLIPDSGSRVATLNTTYEKFLGDEITYDAGDLAFDINSAVLSVDNAVETLPRNNTKKQRVVEGNRTIEVSATVVGEAEYQRQITRYLQAQGADIVWNLTNNTVTVNNSVMTTVGDKSVEEGGAYMQFDNVFQGRTIDIE